MNDSRPSINEPAKVEWATGTTRLFNLVIALINAQSPRSPRWLIANVEGYDSPTEAAQLKQLRRDRQSLEALGVTLDIAPNLDGEEGWRLDPAQTFLPQLDLSAEEADVLATASRWAQPEHLAPAATSAYRKLVAAGIRRHMTSDTIPSMPDHLDMDADSIVSIFRALERDLCISFDYYPAPLVEPSRRQLEPWAIGAVDGRLYVTGFDLDKQAQRTFRLARLADVDILVRIRKHPVPEEPSERLIARGLARSGEYVTATMTYSQASGAEELRQITSSDGTIGPVERGWLVRTAASYAPIAVVTSPPDVVDDIRALLEQAATQMGAECCLTTDQLTETEDGA